jgi:hypothetical protein
MMKGTCDTYLIRLTHLRRKEKKEEEKGEGRDKEEEDEGVHNDTCRRKNRKCDTCRRKNRNVCSHSQFYYIV